MADTQPVGKARGKDEDQPVGPAEDERRYSIVELENAPRALFNVSVHTMRGALSLSPRKTHNEQQVRELLDDFATRTPN